MISIIHPSRGRPEKAAATIEKWQENSDSKKYEWILSCDRDDSEYTKYIKVKNSFTSFALISHNNRSAIDAINNAAKLSTGDILIVVSDDTDCVAHWDTDLLLNIKRDGLKDFALKTIDGIQRWIITMPIIDRTYYNRFGYIYHPDYTHMFCDTEFTCVADLTGRKHFLDITFRHNHYSVTKEQPDAINKKADATWAQGEKLFLERYKRNFDLQPEDIKGKIQDNGMINWLQKKR